jgi:hypothetical protein
MDNEEIMYRRLRPLRTGGLSLNEARDILLESMGPMLDQLDAYGRPVPPTEALILVDQNGRLPYDQRASGYPDGTINREHWPRTNDPVDTIYGYPDEPPGNTRQPGTAGLNKFGYRPGQGDAALLGRALYAEGRGDETAWPGLAWSIVNRIDPAAKGARKSL